MGRYPFPLEAFVVNPRVAGFSLSYVVKTGIAAIVFILFAKWLTAKVPVPGLAHAVAAV